MIAVEAFVQGEFMILISESYWSTSNSGCLYGPPYFVICFVAGLHESQSQALNSHLLRDKLKLQW